MITTVSITARKLTPAGLLSSVAVGAAIEVARGGAEKISDMVDKKMQDEFDKVAEVNTRGLLLLFLRDLIMALHHYLFSGSFQLFCKIGHYLLVEASLGLG